MAAVNHPRRPYIKKVNSEGFKQQLQAVYDSDGDWRNLAVRLGVKNSTAYRWVTYRDEPQNQHGGSRRIKIGPNQKAFIEDTVDANPLTTLKEMKALIQHRYGIVVSGECVRNHLNGLLFSLKKMIREPENANSVANKEKRRDYVQHLLQYQADSMPIVYIDETNFNWYISRTFGRSKKGSRCTTIAAGTRGANIHVIGCISSLGFLYHEIRRGSFKKEQAQTFVRQCLRVAFEKYHTPVVLVADNAPCHSGIEQVFLEPEFAHHFFLRLGPYSPMFNPIEGAWSVLKAGVKSDVATALPDVLAGQGQGNLTQTEFQATRLEEIIANNIPKVTISKCAALVAQVQRHIPGALNLEDVEF